MLPLCRYDHHMGMSKPGDLGADSSKKYLLNKSFSLAAHDRQGDLILFSDVNDLFARCPVGDNQFAILPGIVCQHVSHIIQIGCGSLCKFSMTDEIFQCNLMVTML